MVWVQLVPYKTEQFNFGNMATAIALDVVRMSQAAKVQAQTTFTLDAVLTHKACQSLAAVVGTPEPRDADGVIPD